MLSWNRIFKNENLGEAVLDRLTIYMAVGVIIRSRLGHCLFYEPGYYFRHPLEILMIWHGGLASHWGCNRNSYCSLAVCQEREKRLFLGFDRIAIVVALSGFLIRMGNLMNSEIYGMKPQFHGVFVFLRNHEVAPKHPTQIYEGLAYLAIFVPAVQFVLVEKGGALSGMLISFVCISGIYCPFLYRISEGKSGCL